MREPTYFLLAGLLDGPRHGYAIAQLAGSSPTAASACPRARSTARSSA